MKLYLNADGEVIFVSGGWTPSSWIGDVVEVNRAPGFPDANIGWAIVSFGTDVFRVWWLIPRRAGWEAINYVRHVVEQSGVDRNYGAYLSCGSNVFSVEYIIQTETVYTVEGKTASKEHVAEYVFAALKDSKSITVTSRDIKRLKRSDR